MTKKQHYMTKSERDKLEAWLRVKKPVSWIARELGFCRQTIYNEIKRGQYHRIVERHGYYYDEQHYSSDKAQQLHTYNQTGKGRPLKIGTDRAYADFLEEKIMKDRFSPAAALAAARAEGHRTTICVSTLYSYIDKGIFLHLTNKHLWEKGRKKKRDYAPIRRIAHPRLPSIENRPEQINQRIEPGHWEMDLVVSCRGGHKCLMALTERVTRQEIMRLIPDKSAASVVRAMNTLERKYGKMFPEVFKTITVDNGTEFSDCEGMETSVFKAGGQRTKMYYCHPYCSSERGSNEKQNQMIRRKFPKGTNFDKVSPKEVRVVEDWLNRYPRKILGWYSSADLFNQIFGGI